MTQMDVTTLKTAVGWLRIEAFAGELTQVDLFTKLEPAAESTSTVLQEAVQQLQAYLDGSLQRFSLPLAWSRTEGFRREVLQVVAGIPFGELMSYGEIAKLVGKPGASQAVGAAVGSNPWLIVIPCHRVIGSDCKLHGFSAPGGLETKTWLLRHEGHKIIRGKVSLKGS
jgi:methylated-DNA-[protein]-cysteine S-methyltransferase